MRPLGRLTCAWNDKIRTDLRERGLEGVNWKFVAQDRNQWWVLVKTVIKLRVP
jgi:hypothetical protein